jgi:hypothetical protein
MRLEEAIYKLNKDVVSISNETAYDLNGNIVNYDKAQAEALVATNAYKLSRAAEYPSYADQFDKIFHEGIDAWKAQIQAVKDKYPKGGEQ